MSEAGASQLLESRHTLGMVSLLTIILFAFANLPWELESYDQAKQAFVSWQMVNAPVSFTATEAKASPNRFIYQETPGGKVATKPPLIGWVAAGFYEVTRSWEVAWRLPSLCAAVVMAWLLWRSGSLFGNVGGLIALSAFSFNLLTPRLATLVRTDMPLALVAFLIAWLFFDQIRKLAPWTARERFILFLLLAASMLIKGPIVYAFVLPAMVLFAWRYRGESIARSIATGWWPWIFSLAIFIGWVVGGVETMPRFYQKVVLREFVGRFSETFHRPQPILFYIPHLLHKWAPWSLLLIALLVMRYRAARPPAATEVKPKRRWFGDWSPELFWLLAWGIGGLIVMSCIPSKRVDRIFPALPPLCLLLGAMVGERFARGSDPESRLQSKVLARGCAVAVLLAAICTFGYAGSRIVSGFAKQRDALVKCGREFRTRATKNHWRYAVLKTSTEALVFYLDVPGFTSESEALRRWKEGELDTLIGSEKRIESVQAELGGSTTTQTDFCHKVKGHKRYLVQRRVSP